MNKHPRIMNEHNYAATSSNASRNDLEQTEMATRDQNRSKYWCELRKTHVTASNFYGI